MKKILNQYSLLLSGILMWSCISFAQKNQSNVTIKGKLHNFQNKVELEDHSDVGRMIPNSKNVVITSEKDSTFDITFTLEKPGYFRLGRNILYLSPGNVLEVSIDHSNSKLSTFKGKGSSENSYLCNTLFPKAGSFLNAGRNLKNTPQETHDFILQEAEKRQKELHSLKGVSKEFVRLEEGRIRADVIKSMKSVAAYSNLLIKTKSPDQIKLYVNEFDAISKKSYDSLIHDFIDASLLQVEVYRDIIGYLKLEDPGAKAGDVKQISEFKKASSLAFKIKEEGDKSKIITMIPTVDSLTTQKYKDALYATLNEKLKFGNGDSAKDLTLINADGKVVKLSDLKGKVIYIDIWATWCGPCMAEMPNLELMKKKYANHSDLAIVSLSVDDTDAIWLRNLAQRKPEGIQWRINRANLAEYEVESIPRYILIDKNHKIVEFYAPRPSAIELSTKINKLLGI